MNMRAVRMSTDVECAVSKGIGCEEEWIRDSERGRERREGHGVDMMKCIIYMYEIVK